jgi:HK97 family phage major capsid protein
MYSKILTATSGGSSLLWICSATAYAKMLTMTSGQSNILQPLNQPGVPAGTMTMFGIPILKQPDHTSALGTAGDLWLVNRKGYVTANRGSIELMASTDRYFDYNQTAYRIIMQVDGRPHLTAPMTGATSSDTLSTFIRLS